MCGICGELIISGTDCVHQDVLQAMRDTMAHRGPDDAGMWLSADQRTGLGHRRLSIVDLSPAGHQPISNEDGTVWITFNGEIYNHVELRKKLENLGHVYRSHTDTETIVHLYEEYGEDCVKQLDGMFAFAIWDDRRGRLLLARDRLGKKPLYFWKDGERFIFASEIKALLRHPRVPKRPNVPSIYDYLSMLSVPAPQTMFAGVQKLRPAECLLIGCDGVARSWLFWDPFEGDRSPETMSEQECKDRVIDLLRKSIEKRMMADVPFGVFLSGGVDSSTNVALMSQLMTRPVDTFSVALAGDEDSNEFSWARRVAEYFHCNHHEVVVQTPQFLQFAQEMPYYQDEPLGDPVCVPLYYVSKLARDNGVIVVQVGEGSDEIFAGYDGYRAVLERHRWAQLWQRLMPSSVKRAAAGFAEMMNATKEADFLRRLSAGEEIFWGGGIAFYEMQKHQLLRPEFLSQMDGKSTWERIRPFYASARQAGGQIDFLQQMIYVELKHRLSEVLLMRVDKMGMAASVEARVPFLDYKLVEFAMRLPSRLKVKNGIGKYILKEAVRPLLPPGVVDRPKRGFCGSAPNMLQGEIMAAMTSDLQSSPFLRDAVKPDALTALINSTDPVHRGLKLWNLWNLALWHKRWFE